MDLPVVYYERSDYQSNVTENKIYRGSIFHGTQNIMFMGKCIVEKDVIVRGDLATITTGKHCIVRSGTLIRPTLKSWSKGQVFYPVFIGDHVFIEEDSVIAAERIYSFVHIGKGSVIGQGTVIKECCRILPGSVVPAGVTYPTFSTIGGNPAKIVGSEPECTEQLMRDVTIQFHDQFIPSDSICAPDDWTQYS